MNKITLLPKLTDLLAILKNQNVREGLHCPSRVNHSNYSNLRGKFVRIGIYEGNLLGLVYTCISKCFKLYHVAQFNIKIDLTIHTTGFPSLLTAHAAASGEHRMLSIGLSGRQTLM